MARITTDSLNTSHTFNRRVVFILLVILSLSIPAILGQVVSPRKDFHNNLWGPASLFLQGKNPYDTSSLKAELAPLWNPVTLGLFAPLGWLDELVATQIWFLFNVAALAVIIYLLAGKNDPPLIVLWAGVLAFLFPPSINHFALGQISILSALSLLLAALFIERKQLWSSAFFLVVGSAKPHLWILPAIGLISLVWRRGGLRETIRYGMYVLLIALGLCLPLFVTGSAWFASFLSNIKENPAWVQPSLFSWLHETLGIWAFLAWALVFLAGAVACVWIWRAHKPPVAMAWSLGLTTLLSPYIWSWDFVLLLPAWIFVFLRVEWRIRLLLFVIYLGSWAGMAAIQLKANAVNALYWWLPIVFLSSAALAKKMIRENFPVQE